MDKFFKMRVSESLMQNAAQSIFFSSNFFQVDKMYAKDRQLAALKYNLADKLCLMVSYKEIVVQHKYMPSLHSKLPHVGYIDN